MKHNLAEIMEALGGAAAVVALVLFMWTLVAVIGISEGSNDLATESFKAAVAVIGSIFRVG